MTATVAGTRPPRPVPVRSAAFDHLDLAALRGYRRVLAEEEGRVSYWRRLVQARLDLLRAAAEGRPAGVDRLRDVLADRRVTPPRTAVVDLLPGGDLPPLPDLPLLWTRLPATGDEAATARLVAGLAGAESQLSAYRSALHRRIEAATTELIARYRENPALCLAVLPLDPPVRARSHA